MKRFILLFVGLFYLATVFAQKPYWRWATYPDNSKAASASKVAQDAVGNIYTVGVFTGTITLGDSVYTAIGTQSMYLAKYDNNGILIWSKAFSGTGTIVANALAIDENGDVYIGGIFTNTIKVSDSMFTSVGGKDMFIMKCSSQGIPSWSKAYGTIYDDYIESISINSKHNVFISGLFSNEQSSPPLHEVITFGNFTLISHGDTDPFIVKYDSIGNVLWAKNPGDKFPEYALDIAIDKNDNFYIVGIFSSRTYFDSIVVGSISNGFVVADIFLAKYDSSGNALWAKAIGGYKASGASSPGVAYGTLVTVDTAGNPIIGGNYTACNVIFDKYDYSTSLGGQNMWMAKYSSNGNLIWSRSMGGGDEHLNEIACDKLGNLYLTGEYSYGCLFDTISLFNIDEFSSVRYMFVAKYNNDGRVQWVQTAGDTAGAVGNGLAVNNPDEVVVGGQFYGNNSIKFGNATCYNTGTTGNGFVAKMSKSGVGVPHTTAGQFSLSPNPATDEIRLHMQQPGGYSRYVIINTIGAIVSHGELSAQQEQTFSLPDVPAGLYYLTLSGNKESATQKLSIQH